MIMNKTMQMGKIALGLVLISSGLVGCKSTEDSLGLNPERIDKTRAAIEKTIDEPERQAAILELANRLEQEAKTISDEALAIRAKISEANRDYDTTREELETLYDELGHLLQKQADFAKQLSMEARKLCSEEEWEEIMSHRTDAINFTF